jgi:hypothetical protein
VFAEAGEQPNAFHDRGARSLKRISTTLTKWNAGGKHRAAIGRLQAQLQPVCAKLPAGEPSRATCDGLLKPDSTKA